MTEKLSGLTGPHGGELQFDAENCTIVELGTVGRPGLRERIAELEAALAAAEARALRNAEQATAAELQKIELRERAEGAEYALAAANKRAEKMAEILSGLVADIPPHVLEIVIRAATRHGVRTVDVLTSRRSRPVVAARYAAIRRVKELTGASSAQIGKWLRADPSTILLALKQVV